MKQVFIINGRGGVGKDTVCTMAGSFWKVRNISSITPIEEIAKSVWDGQKTPASRRLLSDLKQAFVRFNDLPFRYCMEQYESFLHSDDEILFVHIREPEEIDRFKKAVGANCHTILVRRPVFEKEHPVYGNTSDDNVENYEYDILLRLTESLETMPEQVYQCLFPFMDSLGG